MIVRGYPSDYEESAGLGIEAVWAQTCDHAPRGTAKDSLWLECPRRHAIRHIHSQWFLLRRRSPVFEETRNDETGCKLSAYLIVKAMAKLHRFTLFQPAFLLIFR